MNFFLFLYEERQIEFVKMKIFQTAERKLASLGITPNQSLKNHPFNRQISMGSFIFAVSISSQFAFLFRFANTFMDYTASAYLIATTISIIVCFVSVVFERQKLFDIIEGFKQIVNMSK